MKTMRKKLVYIAVCLLSIGVVSASQMIVPAYAQESGGGKKIIDRKLTTTEIGYNDFIKSDTDVLTKVLYLVYAWAGIIGVIVIIIAGYLFTTARGDPSQMKRSKDAVRGAVIGLVVVSLAFVITRFIIGRVQ